jgi:uncharacterized protein
MSGWIKKTIGLAGLAWVSLGLATLFAPGICGAQTAPTANQPGAPIANSIARIALMLPTHSDNLATAANAVRAGVMAGFERDSHGVSVQLIETGDTVPEILDVYQALSGEYDLIIGPLARSAANGLALSNFVSKPTLVLSQLDPAPLPANSSANILAIGLSIEDEARQAANWAASDKTQARLLVLTSNVAWQRRAAKAFVAQWQSLGRGEITPFELFSSSGYFSASGLKQLKAKIHNEKPNLVFIAMDAAQIRQMRPLLASDANVYATSQINGTTRISLEAEENEPAPLLDGIRVLDLPWQLQPDHSAVMIYPRLSNEAKPPADNERLYALGVDAYRIAREILLGQTASFKIDGVTGKLAVQFGRHAQNRGTPRFERQLLPAVYRTGSLQPWQKNP